MLAKPLQILALCAAASFCPPHPAYGQNAAALVSQDIDNAKCTRPDHRLIRRETDSGTVWTSEGRAPGRYNEQARVFNDCTRRFVLDADRQINIIRTDALGRIDKVAADATAQIRGIEAQINAADDAVKSDSAYAAPAGQAAAFPDPECDHLKDRARDDTVRIRDRQNCMRDWVGQAQAEIVQINAGAHVTMDAMAGDANRQIHEINVTIIAALAEVRVAAAEQTSALTELKASILPAELPPGTENVTVTGPKPPRSADTPTGVGDPDAISCRAPQISADSRLPGPEVCKRNREWAVLFQRGENLAPDGRTVVAGEKERTFDPQTCITTHSVTGLPAFTMMCGRGP
jgi:hypothetical protein